MRSDIPAAIHNLGYVAVAERDVHRVRTLFVEALRLHNNMHNRVGISECLAGLAGVAGAEGKAERAARLFGAAEALREALGNTMWPAEKVDYERNLATARAQLDEQVWQTAWQEGRAMSMEHAIEYALLGSGG